MTLYEMTTAANALYEMLCNNEIDAQTITDTLEAMGAEEKLESYCKVIRQLEADAEALKAEKARIADKQKTVENSVARMKIMMLYDEEQNRVYLAYANAEYNTEKNEKAKITYYLPK